MSQQSLMPALMSLHKVYPRRNLPAEMMRNNQVLAILSEPAKMSAVPETETVREENNRIFGDQKTKLILVKMFLFSHNLVYIT